MPFHLTELLDAADFDGVAPTDEYVVSWSDAEGHFVLTEPGGDFYIASALDFGSVTGPDLDGYVISWDDNAGLFVLVPQSGGDSSPATGHWGFLGDGVNATYTVTHGLDSWWLITQFYDATTQQQVFPDTVVVLDADSIQVGFEDVVGVDGIRVVVVSIEGPELDMSLTGAHFVGYENTLPIIEPSTGSHVVGYESTLPIIESDSGGHVVGYENSEEA